jgi:hypothetical protein
VGPERERLMGSGERRVQAWWDWRNLALGVVWDKTAVHVCLLFLSISIWRRSR